MSLHEELAAAQRKPVRCHLCKFLATLKPAERAEWIKELADPTNPNVAIIRVLAKRGLTISQQAVTNHRSHP